SQNEVNAGFSWHFAAPRLLKRQDGYEAFKAALTDGVYGVEVHKLLRMVLSHTTMGCDLGGMPGSSSFWMPAASPLKKSTAALAGAAENKFVLLDRDA